MLTVGRDIRSSSASRQLTSCTQWSTPSCRFVTCSSRLLAASAIMAFSAGESGRALSANPSIAGSLPSEETSVASASTKCHAGLSTRALLLEWMSLRGPRPQRSPLDTSSHSITPFAPRVMVTRPSDPCAAAGMKIPMVRRRAACTSGRRTIWGKCGDPISSSPSATSTTLSGGFLPGPVDQRGPPRRRGPLRRIRLLDVVHEIEAEGARRAGVERGEDAGLTVRRDLRDLAESRLPQQAHGEVAALGHAPVLGGDRRLPDPLLQALHRLVVAFLDLGEDRGEVGLMRPRGAGQRERGGGGGGALQEGSAIQAHERPPRSGGPALRRPLDGAVFYAPGRMFCRTAQPPRPSCGVAARAAAYEVLLAGFRQPRRSARGGTVVKRLPLVALCALLLSLASVGRLTAQGGVIRGHVADSAGAPLARVAVSVEAVGATATTNDRGDYEIRGVPAGTHTVRARLLGYVAQTVRVSVSDQAPARQDFRLAAQPIGLAPVDVVVGSRARHTAAEELAVPVDVFTAEQLTQQGTTETSQILQQLAPSVNFPRQSVTDANDIVRPFTLRGLSPDQTLVLVN